jgi:hypothetical protein
MDICIVFALYLLECVGMAIVEQSFRKTLIGSLLVIVVITSFYFLSSSKTSIISSSLSSPSESLYDYFSSLERPYTNDYALYVLNPYDETYLSTFDLSYEEIVKLDFIEYKKDILSQGIEEYPQYPVETLQLGTGDCEDIAILQCAFLKQKGHDVSLIRYDGHMAAGIMENGQYIPINKDDARHGEPTDYHPITDRPILSANAKYSSRSIELNITNYGTEKAEGILIETEKTKQEIDLYPYETKVFSVQNLLGLSIEKTKVTYKEEVVFEGKEV